MKNKRARSAKFGSSRKKVISDVSPSTSIPPLVEGQVRCFLRVTVSRVLWTIGKPPPLTLVRLRWWGESTTGTLFCPRDGSLVRQKDVKSTSRFPVRCGPKQFTSYLTDMGSLVLDVLTKPDHLPIARVQIAGIARLSLSHSINGFFTLVSPTSEKLGELQVSLALEPLTETYDSSSSVPTTDMSVDAALSAPGLISDQNMLAPPVSHFGPSKSGKESVGGSSNSTPRGKDHLYFQEMGDLPLRSHSPLKSNDIMRNQKLRSGGSRVGVEVSSNVQDTNEPNTHFPSGDSHASVDLLSVLLERGSKLRNAMVVSALKSDIGSHILKETDLPLPKDSIAAPPLLPPISSSGQLLQDILHSELQHPSQDSDLRPECNADTHGEALDLLLGSVNGSELPIWDGDCSPPGSLSGCSSVLLDSELGDPQYDQSLLENLFYKTAKSDGEDDSTRKPSTEKNNRLNSDPGQHGGPKNMYPGLSVNRIALLGGIHLARVAILQLTVPTDNTPNTPKKLSGKGRPPRPLTNKKCSYFVEYLFPLALTNNESQLAVPAEVTRVVSSKILEGVVQFQQRSVFPVHFNGPTIKRWWDINLAFSIYCRKSFQKKPVPIGRAVLPLRAVLQSDRLTITTVLPVQRLDGDSGKSDVGPLKVSLELATDKKNFSSKIRPEKTVGSPGVSPRKAPAPGLDDSTGPQSDEYNVDFHPVFESDHKRDKSPLRVPPVQSILMPQARSRSRSRSISPNSRSCLHKSPHNTEENECDILLHTLLMVPDGRDFNCAPMQPNVYLNCKLFGSEETTRSVVSWGQRHPTFNLVQVAPVALNSKLLERMKNNMMVLEVWLKASSPDSDKLLGLVKLPLHQFYMSFRDPRISQLLLKAHYPVLAVDSYMPVVDIFTGGTRGSLRVCLAMGLAQQITILQDKRDDEMASVSQLARPVHLLDHRPTLDTKAIAASPAEALNEHVFLVRVERMKGLTPLQSTVWGEADCYIHYSFPAQEEEAAQDVDPHVVESSINLKSFRTATTLCVPDPVFGHCETHMLLAPPAVPVQRLLLSSVACQGPSSGGGIQFEVWCRYYYPNVREQLVARGVLPVAKLCAMVTMQRQGQTETQLFSLPLIPRTDRHSDVQPQPSGLLEVSVRYKTRPVRSNALKSAAVASRVISLVVQVHRAAGLQAAARALALQYYSEVGVNSFVTVQLSLLSERESRSTRVVARSFCPEFEHHAEFCCQLLVQRDTGESMSLAELLQEGEAIFTVYNRDTRKGVDTSVPKDSVLGSLKIHLSDLLHKKTGISGWYGLSLPLSMSSHCNLSSVGGLELSIHFAHHADRERVLRTAQLLGWEAERDAEEQKDKEEGDCSETMQTMALLVSMPRAWLPVHCLLLPGHSELQRSTYCYYRYKLYDQEAYCSELRHPALEEGEAGEECSGLATVGFSGSRTIKLRSSQPLHWYLREERLEVQLWVTFGKEKRLRPHDSDRLLGSAFMDLSALAMDSKRKQIISGVYPLFKRSAADLGGAALRAHITATSDSALPPGPALAEEEQLTSSGEEEEDQRPSSRQSHVPDNDAGWSRISSRQHTKSALSSEVLPPSRGTELTNDDTFTATVSVERAMHLSLKGCPLAERSGGLPSCCVCYATADASGTVSTDVVQDSDCPVWDDQQECRLSKELLLDPQQSLVFKVWHKGEIERVIGFASVDLSPLLSGFQSVCGWYNITDFSGQCQGQVKVSVSPLTGVQELRTQRQALSDNTPIDHTSLFSALPLCYQTTAMYSSFPSHISRFSEQRISTPPEHMDRLLSARSSLTNRHDEHVDNVRRFHHALHDAENNPLSSCAGDAQPSSSALFLALRKNLSELDDIQKYFSRKLSTPVFSGLGEQGQGSRHKEPRVSETDTTQLLLKSNQLVGEVNNIIKGLSDHQTEAASLNMRQTPSTPAEREMCGVSDVAHLTESCDTEVCSQKEPESELKEISHLTSPERLSPSPISEDEEVHQSNGSSEDENEHKENEVEEEEEIDEEFEETLVEPRPLNEVTSVTDRTSPWTSVLSDPDLGSLESLEEVEQPLRHCPSTMQEMKRGSAGSHSATLLQPVNSQPAGDSDLSDCFESSEDTEAARHVPNVYEEHSDEEEPLAVGLQEVSIQDAKQIAGRDQHDTSDSEDDLSLPPTTGSSTKTDSDENEKIEAKVSDSVDIPNFFLPSHHLEASMRALRLAPVFPSSSSNPEIVKSDRAHRKVARPRPNIPPSSAKKEETKRIAKIFASHFTEES